MRPSAPRIGVEILLMALVLVLLAGALGLITAVYRTSRPKPEAAPVVAEAPRPEPKPEPEPPLPPPEPPPAPEDLTPARLREIAAREAEQAEAARSSDRRAEALEAAVAAARAEADRFRARERLVREGAARADLEARRAEDEADALARERDVLAERRKDQKELLDHARLRARDGVAVLPYKGPNGTWRRPIAIECRGPTATLQPGGPSFHLGESAGFVNSRSHPLVSAVARAMLRSRDLATPDGSASVPYLMFLVRPDGVRSFYAARGLLEPLGIAYGYELADADWDVEFPDLDDPAAWTDAPGPNRTPAWPPPPSARELAGSGGGNLGPAAGGVASVAMPGGAGPYDGTPGPRPTGGTGAGRVVPSPGDGRGMGPNPGSSSPIAGTGAGGWGRLGSGRAGGLGDELGPGDLESIARGDGDGRRTPDDGRVLVVPGDRDERPTFEPTPTSGMDEDGSPRGTARPDPRRDPGRTYAEGNAGRVPGLVGDRLPAPPGPSRSRTLGEAIARNEGLTAPTLSPPSRSIPSPPDRAAGGATGAPPGSSGGPMGTPSGGAPGGASGAPAGSSGGGVDAPGGESGSSGASPDDSNGLVSRTLEMTVACGPKGVTVYPGGESLDLAALTADDGRLPGALAGIVRARSAAEPNVGLRPRVRFLVKPGGESTYLKARWQTSRAGTGWPTTLQVADRSAPRLGVGGRP